MSLNVAYTASYSTTAGGTASITLPVLQPWDEVVVSVMTDANVPNTSPGGPVGFSIDAGTTWQPTGSTSYYGHSSTVATGVGGLTVATWSFQEWRHFSRSGATVLFKPIGISPSSVQAGPTNVSASMLLIVMVVRGGHGYEGHNGIEPQTVAASTGGYNNFTVDAAATTSNATTTRIDQYNFTSNSSMGRYHPGPHSVYGLWFGGSDVSVTIPSGQTAMTSATHPTLGWSISAFTEGYLSSVTYGDILVDPKAFTTASSANWIVWNFTLLEPISDALPPNDNLANAVSLTADAAPTSGTVLNANMEDNELDGRVLAWQGNPSAYDDARTVWYSFTPSTTGRFRVFARSDRAAYTSLPNPPDYTYIGSTANRGFTSLTLWTGSAHPLTFIDYDESEVEAYFNTYGNEIFFDGTAGTTYYVGVQNEWTDAGDSLDPLTFTVKVETMPAMRGDTYIAAPTITGLSGAESVSNAGATAELFEVGVHDFFLQGPIPSNNFNSVWRKYVVPPEADGKRLRWWLSPLTEIVDDPWAVFGTPSYINPQNAAVGETADAYVKINTPGMIIPTYDAPGPGSSWETLTNDPTGVDYLVCKDRDGHLAGQSADPTYAAAISAARAAGLKVMYYIFADIPNRTEADIQAEIDAWANLYGAADGYLFDQPTLVVGVVNNPYFGWIPHIDWTAPTNANAVYVDLQAYVQTNHAQAKIAINIHRNAATEWMNSYGAVCDYLIVGDDIPDYFAGNITIPYRDMDTPTNPPHNFAFSFGKLGQVNAMLSTRWLDDLPPTGLVIWAHDCADTSLIATAHTAGIARVYLTGGDSTYTQLSGYMSQLRSATASLVGTPAELDLLKDNFGRTMRMSVGDDAKASEWTTNLTAGQEIYWRFFVEPNDAKFTLGKHHLDPVYKDTATLNWMPLPDPPPNDKLPGAINLDPTTGTVQSVSVQGSNMSAWVLNVPFNSTWALNDPNTQDLYWVFTASSNGYAMVTDQNNNGMSIGLYNGPNTSPTWLSQSDNIIHPNNYWYSSTGYITITAGTTYVIQTQITNLNSKANSSFDLTVTQPQWMDKWSTWPPSAVVIPSLPFTDATQDLTSQPTDPNGYHTRFFKYTSPIAQSAIFTTWGSYGAGKNMPAYVQVFPEDGSAWLESGSENSVKFGGRATSMHEAWATHDFQPGETVYVAVQATDDTLAGPFVFHAERVGVAQLDWANASTPTGVLSQSVYDSNTATTSYPAATSPTTVLSDAQYGSGGLLGSNDSTGAHFAVNQAADITANLVGQTRGGNLDYFWMGWGAQLPNNTSSTYMATDTVVNTMTSYSSSYKIPPPAVGDLAMFITYSTGATYAFDATTDSAGWTTQNIVTNGVGAAIFGWKELTSSDITPGATTFRIPFGIPPDTNNITAGSMQVWLIPARSWLSPANGGMTPDITGFFDTVSSLGLSIPAASTANRATVTLVQPSPYNAGSGTLASDTGPAWDLSFHFGGQVDPQANPGAFTKNVTWDGTSQDVAAVVFSFTPVFQPVVTQSLAPQNWATDGTILPSLHGQILDPVTYDYTTEYESLQVDVTVPGAGAPVATLDNVVSWTVGLPYFLTDQLYWATADGFTSADLSVADGLTAQSSGGFIAHATKLGGQDHELWITNGNGKLIWFSAPPSSGSGPGSTNLTGFFFSG